MEATDTRIVFVGGEVQVKGLLDDVNGALNAAGFGRAALEDSYGRRVYVSPSHILYMEAVPGPESEAEPVGRRRITAGRF